MTTEKSNVIQLNNIV